MSNDPLEMLGRLLNGELTHEEAEAFQAEMIGDLLGASLNPEPDMPAALSAFAETLLPMVIQSDVEARQWAERAGELEAALNESPPIVREFITYLHGTFAAMSGGILGVAKAMEAAFDEVEADPEKFLAGCLADLPGPVFPLCATDSPANRPAREQGTCGVCGRPIERLSAFEWRDQASNVASDKPEWHEHRP